MTDDILQRVRAAIDEVWGSYISEDSEARKRIIEQSTYIGSEDPGQWSPKAAVIIHCERGIPNGSHSTRLMEKWWDVSDKLGTHFCEHINTAVIGVYKG